MHACMRMQYAYVYTYKYNFRKQIKAAKKSCNMNPCYELPAGTSFKVIHRNEVNKIFEPTFLYIQQFNYAKRKTKKRKLFPRSCNMNPCYQLLRKDPSNL